MGKGRWAYGTAEDERNVKAGDCVPVDTDSKAKQSRGKPPLVLEQPSAAAQSFDSYDSLRICNHFSLGSGAGTGEVVGARRHHCSTSANCGIFLLAFFALLPSKIVMKQRHGTKGASTRDTVNALLRQPDFTSSFSGSVHTTRRPDTNAYGARDNLQWSLTRI